LPAGRLSVIADGIATVQEYDATEVEKSGKVDNKKLQTLN
jgi:hypothetical protein